MTSASAQRRLVTAYLRSDRVLLPAWIVGGVFLYVAQAKSIDRLYPTDVALHHAAESMTASTAMLAMTGPAHALDTLGGQVAWQSATYGAVVAGLMSMLVVVRHTRVEEETGRSALVRSGSVDPLTPIRCAVAVALAANLALGGLVALSLIGYGLPKAGCWALGAALTTTGWVFTGVASVACQLTASSRSAYAITTAAVGAAFLVRALGDTTAEALSWASPIGWGQASRPFADERWWPLVLSMTVAALLIAAATAMHERRDHGTGLWSARLRTSSAKDHATGPWQLTWRLQRGPLLGWAASVALVGVGYGAMAESVDAVMDRSDFTADLFAARSTTGEAFLSTAVLTLALLCTAAGIVGAQRPAVEERAGRLDPLLAGRLSRVQWSTQHALAAALGVSALLPIAGWATGVTYALTTHDTHHIWSTVAAATAYTPAALVVTGTIHLAHGLNWPPGPVGWILLAWCTLVALFGQTLDLPQALAATSPLEHVARMPLEQCNAGSAMWLGTTALLLYIGAHALLRRRDLR